MPITTNDFSAKIANYRYFAVNIITNEVVAELPISDVSFERALKGAGAFSGTIAIAPDTKDLNLYDNTMPGKTALYVTRNNICVWGGIIWSRDYTLVSRTLTISASEFTSYLQHRLIWKTFNYDIEAIALKKKSNSLIRIVMKNKDITFPTADASGNRTKVKLSFSETGIGGYYNDYYDLELSYSASITKSQRTGTTVKLTVPGHLFRVNDTVSITGISTTGRTGLNESGRLITAVTKSTITYTSANSGTLTELTTNGSVNITSVAGSKDSSEGATESYFFVDIPKLPVRPDSYYSAVTVTSKVDTYDYARKLITEAFNDFTSVEFANELVEPGVTKGYKTTYRQVTNGIATITTSEPHGLIVGQTVQLTNVQDDLDNDIDKNETWIVTEVPSSTTYKFDTGNSSLNIALNGSELSETSYPLKYRSVVTTKRKSIEKVSVTSNVATVTTKYPHFFKVGDVLILDFEKEKIISKDVKSSVLNKDEQGAVVIATPNKKTFTYSLTTANTASDGVKVSNSYVNYAVPRKRLELDTYDATPHDFVARNHVYVSGADNPSWGEPLYSGYHTVTAVESAPKTWFQVEPLYDMTVEPGSTVNIKKFQYKLKNNNNRVINKAYITTETPHGFIVGDIVNIDIKLTGFDGVQTISSVDSDTVFTYKPSPQGKASVKLQDISGKVTRTKSLISSLSKTYIDISQKQRVGSTATITTGTDHNLAEDDYVIINSNDTTFNNNGDPVKITDVISNTRFSYTNSGSAVTLTSASGVVALAYTNFGTALYPEAATCSTSTTTRTITISNHGLEVGDYVVVKISGYEKQFSNDNKPVKVVSVPNVNAFTYTYTAPSSSHTLTDLNDPPGSNVAIVTRAAYVTKLPLTYVKTYGEYPNNSDLGGITFSTDDYSTYPVITNTILGGNLTNIGEHLDKYSENIDGFEYRIDCSIETVNSISTFKRTFVFIPRKPDSLVTYLLANPLAEGEYAPPSAFGADKLIFEYPGNISSVTLQENAENAATRMFLASDSGGSGDASSPRYSAASDNELLSNGWPILDLSEKVDWSVPGNEQLNVDNWGNYDIEEDLYSTASRYLKQSRPPMGEYSIVINGSLDPVVGSYNPGDWCQVIINDDFIKERLASYLEPRKDVILRKIESINVKVPNSPAFPEEITLNLIPEWQIDTSG
jgi:hypothetical protein